MYKLQVRVRLRNPQKRYPARRKGAAARNRNWFQKKGNQVGGCHSQQVAQRSGKQLATRRILNIRTAKLLNKQRAVDPRTGRQSVKVDAVGDV